MFDWKSACHKYMVRMEDLVGTGPEALESDPALAAHLRECERCRRAMASADSSRRLFVNLGSPAVPASEFFVTRVMASIDEQESLASLPSPLWRPLEVLASRFALVAAVVLLALSVFLGEFSPSLRRVDIGSSGTSSPEVVGAWPEPPSQPVTQDEVLMSLVETDNGI
jgi:hypothetical protein